MAHYGITMQPSGQTVPLDLINTYPWHLLHAAVWCCHVQSCFILRTHWRYMAWLILYRLLMRPLLRFIVLGGFDWCSVEKCRVNVPVVADTMYYSRGPLNYDPPQPAVDQTQQFMNNAMQHQDQLMTTLTLKRIECCKGCSAIHRSAVYWLSIKAARI